MIASLPMYDLPEIRGATDALWSAIARHLRAEGVSDVPDTLDRARDAEDQWRDPTLLLSQSCGYPVTHAFSRALRVLATPCHAIVGCETGHYYSLVVVSEDAKTTQLSDLRGEVAAINDVTSHSGMNALGALIAPLLEQAPQAEDQRFFSKVVVSGSHIETLAMIAREEAAVAAIDWMTHALLSRYRPSALSGTRVLAATESVPALPFVTNAFANDELVSRIRGALIRAMEDAQLASVREDLLLRGAVVLPPEAYDVIPRLQATHRLQLGVE